MKSGTKTPLLEARFGGFLYMIIILGGLFAPFAVAPSGMMLGNAALPTIAKILRSEHLYILGGAVQLFVYACDIGIALVFYDLLKPVSRSVALLAAFFRLVFVAIASINIFRISLHPDRIPSLPVDVPATGSWHGIGTWRNRLRGEHFRDCYST
jgi:hypothetical protein